VAYGKTEEILLDYASGGVPLPAGNSVLTAPVQVSNNPGGTNGTLNTNELGEMLAQEFDPPLDPTTGDEDNLDNEQLIVDGLDQSNAWWKTSGRASLLVNPPGPAMVDALPGQGGAGTKVYFSPTGYGGILEAIRILTNPLPGEETPDTMGRALIAAAVPRYTKRFVAMYQSGQTPVTHPWLDRWVGHRYLEEEVNDLYSSFSLGGHVRFTDAFGPKGHRTFEFDLPVVNITAANWTKLPGYPTAPVRPFRRCAIASQPTAGNQIEYDFTYSGASVTQVNREHESLDFDLSANTTDLYVFYQFGVRVLQMSGASIVQAGLPAPTDLSTTPQNLARQWLRQQGYQPSAVVPKNGLPASDVDNYQLWGRTYPTDPGGHKYPPEYRAPRSLAGANRIIAGIRATVAMADNGVSQPANTVGAIIGGVWFHGVQNLKIS
jgi:hypothetical protein